MDQAENITVSGAVLRFPLKGEPTQPAAASPSPFDLPSDDLAEIYTPNGHLVPQTLPCRRIRLATARATKDWRFIASELERATDAIADALSPTPPGVTRLRTPDLEDLTKAWRHAAFAALAHRDPRPQHLRSLIALAAALSGVRFRHGGLRHPRDVAEAAFGALDRAALFALRAD